MGEKTIEARGIGGGARRAGWMLSILVLLFFALDAGGKLIAPAAMIASSPPLGIPANLALYRVLGAILAICALLHAVPRTAALGAVLATGYLGGAVFAQLRVGMPLFSNILFGIYIGVAMWAGLWLRDARVRALL